MTSTQKPVTAAPRSATVSAPQPVGPSGEGYLARGWSYGSAAFLIMLAAPLVLFPRALTLLVDAPLRTPPPHPELHAYLGPLEKVLASAAGYAFIALAAILLLQTGSIPLTDAASLDAVDEIQMPGPTAVPYARPTCAVGSAFWLALGYFMWTHSVLTLAVPSLSLAAFGVFAFMFTDAPKRSKRTGRDKRQSGFPFKNEKLG